MTQKQITEAKALSLKDVYSAWKGHYTNRNQLLYKPHMFVLTFWIVIRYLISLLIRQMLRTCAQIL